MKLPLKHKGLLTHREITILLYVIIVALVAAVAYSTQRQTSSSMECKIIDAVLEESSSQPALHFILKNIGEDSSSYTYIITYNVTGTQTYSETVTIASEDTFSSTLLLSKPTGGRMVVNLRIYKGADVNTDALFHDQTWMWNS